MLAPHQIYMTERDSGEMLYNSTETIIQWRLHCALVYCNISFKIMNLHEKHSFVDTRLPCETAVLYHLL